MSALRCTDPEAAWIADLQARSVSEPIIDRDTGDEDWRMAYEPGSYKARALDDEEWSR